MPVELRVDLFTPYSILATAVIKPASVTQLSVHTGDISEEIYPFLSLWDRERGEIQIDFISFFGACVDVRF